MRIKEVEYVENYKLKLKFSDRKVKIVDLESMIKKSRGIFLPLRKIDYFKQVTLDDSQLSICWPNGADICPDLLYVMGKEVKERSKSTAKSRSVNAKRY